MDFHFIRAFKKGVLIATLTMSPWAQASFTEKDLNHLLEKPLITGASVSADWASLSPGKKLALQYTTSSKVKTLALGGRPGVQSIKVLQDKELADRSILLALDFFFWDSTLSNIDGSLKALEELQGKAEKFKLPLVLGEIPELLPGRQPHRNRLNQAIKDSCAQHVSCFLMPFDQLHRQVLRDGYLMIQKKKYSIQQIVPDGLHLSEPAGDELAARLKALLLGRPKELLSNL